MTRHLITSALPYINGIKHLGNLIGSLLPADVYARFLRQQGHEVLFLCGTDEHGTPAEIASQDAGLPIESYCQTLYETQKEIYQRFSLSFDYFGRSSSSYNHTLTKDFFKQLDERGFIEERSIQQYYSKADGRFLPDRYVEGLCPHCGFDKARGDQCDGCGTLLDPVDLQQPRSALSGSRELTLTQTNHLFLDLRPLESSLQTWVSSHSQWPDVVKGIANKWLKEGLSPRCITRDLKWGIPVPKQGYEAKVFYVWFDAPNAYISITQEWATQKGDPHLWKKWWVKEEGASEVRYTQFMAKDNVPFHAIFWPAVLMGCGESLKLVDQIKGFHWLTYDKGKFSTSQKRGIFTDTALELYPADLWRYFLLSHCPETSDSDFSFRLFAATVNKDLADVLGNFVNRTFALIHKYYQGTLPLRLEEVLDPFVTQVTQGVEDLVQSWEGLQFRQAMQTLRSLWVLGNEYITQKAPWILVKTNPEQAGRDLVYCVHLIRLFAILCHPVMPETSQRIRAFLKDTSNYSTVSFKEAVNFQYFSQGHALALPERLFDKIEEAEVEALTQAYGGEHGKKEDA